VLVGITGHQKLSERCARLVRVEMDNILARADAPLVGLTSLAAGADQIFADAILSAGGQLSVVLPSDNLESSFECLTERARFRTLLDRAYWSAGQAIADRSEVLIAVWDGEPARGLGGTADVVRYARERGKEVHVIWPAGCARH
jgi:hypothetical protein